MEWRTVIALATEVCTVKALATESRTVEEATTEMRTVEAAAVCKVETVTMDLRTL